MSKDQEEWDLADICDFLIYNLRNNAGIDLLRENDTIYLKKKGKKVSKVLENLIRDTYTFVKLARDSVDEYLMICEDYLNLLDSRGDDEEIYLEQQRFYDMVDIAVDELSGIARKIAAIKDSKLSTSLKDIMNSSRYVYRKYAFLADELKWKINQEFY
ncbi:MAG: hypothetical protein QXD62_00775 [Candidatus Woesearchaeota archaeon]